MEHFQLIAVRSRNGNFKDGNINKFNHKESLDDDEEGNNINIEIIEAKIDASINDDN